MKPVRFSAGKDSECVTSKPVRPRMKCSSNSEESCAEQELNGLEEGRDAMTDEEGEGVEGEGPRNKLTSRKRKTPKQHTCRSAIGAHTA